jgi:hypothetical protein
VKRNSWQKLPAQPDIRKAVNCRVCGRQFDPTGFQMLVPGLKLGFDRVECALEASALGVPPERADEAAQDVVRSLPTPAPVPALAGGPVLMAGAAGLRPEALAGANLARARRGDRRNDLPLASGLRARPRPDLVSGRQRLTGGRALDGRRGARPDARAREQAAAREHGQWRWQPARLRAGRPGEDRLEPEDAVEAADAEERRTGGTAEPAAAPASTARGADTRALGAGPHRPRALVTARRPDSRPRAPRRRRQHESRATDAAHRRRHPRLAWPFPFP